MALQSVVRKISVRESVSEAEWKVRVELAACHRLTAHFGVNDLTYNHLSARVPGEPRHLLIKPRTLMFEEVTASALEKYDVDGNPCQDTAPLKGGPLVIHAGILKARPDLNAVFHTHTPANMGVASQKHGLLMINQHAVSFYRRLAYHDFGGYEFNMDQREPLIRSLGDKRVALLRNHGSLVCGRNVVEAFIEHHFLEMACRGQIAALTGGGEYTLISEQVCEFGAKQIERTDPAQAGEKDWESCMRLAMRLDPAFCE